MSGFLTRIADSCRATWNSITGSKPTPPKYQNPATDAMKSSGNSFLKYFTKAYWTDHKVIKKQDSELTSFTSPLLHTDNASSEEKKPINLSLPVNASFETKNATYQNLQKVKPNDVLVLDGKEYVVDKKIMGSGGILPGRTEELTASYSEGKLTIKTDNAQAFIFQAHLKAD